MEKPSKRGKIPPQDWPSIITRYQSGETLASIARTYDCSPPAISYIVSRSRARNATVEGQGPAPASEPLLVKSHPDAATPGGMPSSPQAAPADSPIAAPVTVSVLPAAADSPSERADAAGPPGELRLFADEPAAPHVVRGEATRPREDAPAEPPRPTDPIGNGNAPRSSAPAPVANAEPRRTLHLSLSGGDGGHRQDAQPPAPQQNSLLASAGERGAMRPAPAPAPNVRPPMGQYPPAANGAPKDGGAFIDQALRERVDSDIAAFLAAFDAALDHDTAESRSGLREATDRLLRAGARTRIELERLEARVPLVPREQGRPEARAFRPR